MRIFDLYLFRAKVLTINNKHYSVLYFGRSVSSSYGLPLLMELIFHELVDGKAGLFLPSIVLRLLCIFYRESEKKCFICFSIYTSYTFYYRY